MSPRPIATGTVSFGLVAIPIKMYSTAESSQAVRFNMIHEKCGTRVKYKYYCPTDEELVERDELTKGFQYTKGKYVLFSPDELNALTPEPTHAVEITEFVPAETVDPVYFDKAYYLGPDKGGARPYKLLAEAMKKTGRVALARYAARGKDYVVMVRPYEDGLVMQQLYYGDEVRAFDEVPVDDASVKDSELELAVQLVEQIAKDEFDPQAYRDEIRDQIWSMIEAKIEGEEIVAAAPEEPKAQIIDLMDALKASVGDGDSKGKAQQRKAQRKSAKASGSGSSKKKAAKA